MTLIVAICLEEERKNEESVIMFSDSQAMAGPVSYSMHKIAQIWFKEEPLAIAAGAGDVAMVKKAVDLSSYILYSNAAEEWNEETPSFDQFQEAIQQVEKTLICRILEYEELGVSVDFNLLLGSVSSDGDASLYLFDSRGVAQPVHENPRFACIGSGFVLGGNLLLQQLYSPDLSLDEATLLAAYVINEVSRVDPGVGPFEGESCYFRLEEGKPAAGSIKPRSLREIKSEYKWAKKLLRYVWDQSHLFGPKDYYRLVQQMTKQQKKVERTKDK